MKNSKTTGGATAFDSIFSSVTQKPVGKEEAPAAPVAPAVDAPEQQETREEEKAQTITLADDQLKRKQVNSLLVKRMPSKPIEGYRVLRSGEVKKSKTFFLSPEITRMFKYLKFQENINESEYANIIFEKYFQEKYGKNWKEEIL